MERAQKRILDAQEPGPGADCHGFAARGIGAAAPDGDPVARAGAPEGQVMARQFQDTAHAGLPEKPAVEIENPPGGLGLASGLPVIGLAQKSPESVEEAVETDPTAPSVPVKALMTLDHCVNGASVT